MFHLFVALLLGLSGARRIKLGTGSDNSSHQLGERTLAGRYTSPASMIESSEVLAVESPDSDTVDITDYFVNQGRNIKRKLEGYKCCCDKYKSWRDTMRGAYHANFCVVVQTRRCGDASIAEQISETTKVAHSFESTDGRCEILTTALPAFNKLIDLETVDITEYFVNQGRNIKRKLEGYKCCCDKYKSSKDYIRSAHHANFCVVVQTRRCGDASIAEQIGETTAVAHSFESTDGKCEILRTALPAFSELTGEDIASSSMLEASQQLAVTSPDSETVDITEYFDQSNPDYVSNPKLYGYKCCCDKYKSLKDWLRSAEHMNFCIVAKVVSCGDAGVAAQISETTKVAHSFESTDGKCEILTTALPAFNKLIDLETVDITEYFVNQGRNIKRKLEGYKCCCDKYKSSKDYIRSAYHANFCVVVQTRRCGDASIAEQIGETTAVAHSFESTDGKCEILRTALPAFSELTGDL